VVVDVIDVDYVEARPVSTPPREEPIARTDRKPPDRAEAAAEREPNTNTDASTETEE
jgi:hypothetical protein